MFASRKCGFFSVLLASIAELVGRKQVFQPLIEITIVKKIDIVHRIPTILLSVILIMILVAAYATR
jgi:hypothetical protein